MVAARPIAIWWSLWLVLGCFASLGCAGRGRGDPARLSGGARGHHELQGDLFFEAGYELPGSSRIPPESQIPSGLTPLARVRVCLFEQHGANDFGLAGELRNDRQIGCRTTDSAGHFRFRIPKLDCPRVGDCSRKFYYVTDLCVWSEDKPQACVTVNTRQDDPVRSSSWTERFEYRKFIWSHVDRVSLTDRTSTYLAWNLSCPNESGYGRTQPTCNRPTRGGYFDRAHSNYGYNKEALHVLGAASQVVKVWKNLIPDRANTNGPGGRWCGDPKDRHERAFECQDAVRLVLMKSRRLGMRYGRHCGRSKWGNYFLPWRSACIGEPLQPYATPHEIGHVVHARFMNYRGAMNADDVGWTSGTAQKSQVGEGWADFFATATWFAPDAKAPTVSGHAMERRSSLRSACRRTGPVGELHAAQFFWDLYDEASPAEPNDRVSVTLDMFLRVWSMFNGRRDGFDQRDRTAGECNPHGRNVHDFMYYWRRLGGVGLPDATPLLEWNCVDKHEIGTSCR